MDKFDSSPDSDFPRRRWQEGTDTFGRVYDVALGVTSPTVHTEIAELANCSPDVAKKLLECLAEMGIVQADRESSPVQYERSEGYLEWKDANQIANQLSVEEINERVEGLREKREEYESQFGTTVPKEVSVFDHEDHDRDHERMTAISEWQGVIRDVRLYELARQISQNDGHLIPT